uniref:Uncharacterized protein n=1 Tax=Schlesneria paludicola TaxID=360056 RepID=A0A7C4LNJ9_9PLAN
MMPLRPAPSNAPRRGAAMLLVILAIVVASTVGVTLAHAAINQRRQMRREANRAQAFWLVQSGLQRGWSRATHDPHYAGEDWPLVASGHAALVQIRVKRDPSDSRLIVRTEFPPKGWYRTTIHRELPLPIPLQGPQPAEFPISAQAPENVIP